jgi:Uma2 family endonuclease
MWTTALSSETYNVAVTRNEPRTLVTAEQLESDRRYRECELWDGMPVVKEASGGSSPYVTFRLNTLLGNHLVERPLGWGGNAEVGFLLRRNPDRVLSPDLAFVSFEKLPELPQHGFAQLVPDFVVEVRSPGQSWREVLEKGLIWASHGVSVVWLVDPVARTIVTLRPDAPPLEVGPGGSANAAPALPDFTVAVDDLFRRPGTRVP